MRDQPTPEMEAENAAYVWAEKCLEDHAVEVAKARNYIDASKWQEIAWTFERAKIALERHAALEAARKEKQK